MNDQPDEQACARAACTFCSELRAQPKESRFSALLGDNTDRRFLFRSPNVVVVPGIGQLSLGYVLVRPIPHYVSLGHLPEELMTELDEVVQTVKHVLSCTLKQRTFIFEHGALSERMRGAGCTDHAHLHVMPLDVDVTGAILASSDWERVERMADVKASIVAGRPYLYLQAPSGEHWVTGASGLPKQMIRRVIAGALGRPAQWDWRSGIDDAGRITERSVLETINVLGPAFAEFGRPSATMET